MQQTPRGIPPLPPRVASAMLPRWARILVAAAGLTVPLYRTLAEWYPPYDDSRIIHDFARIGVIHRIMNRMGVPPEVGTRLIIVKGVQNRMIGGANSYPGPLLELSPQLADSLIRSDKGEIDRNSEAGIALRTRFYTDPATNTAIPQVTEFPFKEEREAVIAHEIAHLALNHSQGHMRLNALMAFSAAIFYFRPTLSLVPLAIYGYSLHHLSRKWELEADRKACTMMGPDTTRAMISRLRAKLKVERMILGRHDAFHPAFRHVMLERAYAYLLHVPLPVRIDYLVDILKAQSSQAKKS